MSRLPLGDHNVVDLRTLLIDGAQGKLPRSHLASDERMPIDNAFEKTALTSRSPASRIGERLKFRLFSVCTLSIEMAQPVDLPRQAHCFSELIGLVPGAFLLDQIFQRGKLDRQEVGRP